MLIVETVARIRRAFFVKGQSIKEISRDLKISRNTVRKVLRSGETAFSYERAVQPLPKLGPWASGLDKLLTANQSKARRERLTLMRAGFLKRFRVWAMAVAMMLSGVTRRRGSGSARWSPRRSMFR
jgi:hypothetical protein